MEVGSGGREGEVKVSRCPSSSLGGVVYELGGKAFWSLEQEKATSRERRVWRGRSLRVTEDGAEEKQGCSRCSVAELGMWLGTGLEERSRW